MLNDSTRKQYSRLWKLGFLNNKKSYKKKIDEKGIHILKRFNETTQFSNLIWIQIQDKNFKRKNKAIMRQPTI